MARIAERYNRRTRIEVPEWGDDSGPLVAYAKPYTLADDRRLSRYIKEDSPDGFAEIVVSKLEDQAGEMLFDKADKPNLIRLADAHVVKRVAMEIMAAVSVEIAEKN